MNLPVSIDILYTKKAWRISLAINALLLGLTLLTSIKMGTLIVALVVGLALGVLLGAGIRREFSKPVLPSYYVQGGVALFALGGALLPMTIGSILWALGAIAYLALMTALMMNPDVADQE